MVISYQSASGAITTIIRGRFPLRTYKDVLTGKLRVEKRMTAGDQRNPADESKKLLIYSANIHPRNTLNPANCTTKSSPKESVGLIVAVLPQLDNYPDTKNYEEQGYMDVEAAGVEGAYAAADNACTTAEEAAGHQL